MALRASDLNKKGKSGSTTDEVLVIQNTNTLKTSQFPLDDVFPILQNGSISSGGTLGAALAKTSPAPLFVGGGFGSSVTGTDKNTLIFKGLRSASDALVFKEETQTGNAQKGNIVLDLDASEIDLSLADNTNSNFLSQATLSNSNHVTGTLPVANGGTNATSFPDKSVVLTQVSGTDTLRSLSMTTNGALLIGGTNGPRNTTLTAGTNVTITNSDGGIEISSSIGTISSTLDLGNNNIDLGTGWLSGDGSNEGLNLDSTGKVFIGNSTPTAYFSDALNVGGGITLGSSTGSSQTIKLKDTTTGASGSLTIEGSDASGTGNTGGTISIQAGDGDTNGGGGRLTLQSGSGAGTGADGTITFKVGTSTAGTFNADNDLTLNSGDLKISDATKGLVHSGSGTVTQATDWTTAVTINATSGIITLEATDVLGAHGSHAFTVNNTTVQADSLVFLQWYDVTNTATNMMNCYIAKVAANRFDVRIYNPRSSGGNTTAGIIKIAFLVVNNS